MLTTLIEFLRDNPDPTEQEVRIAISGNLCRCTGYQNIVIAALDAAKRLQAAGGCHRRDSGNASVAPSAFAKMAPFAGIDDGGCYSTSWPSASTISATASKPFASAPG